MAPTKAYLSVIASFLALPLCGMANPTFSWQEPHAEVLPHGDLKWKPRPFAYTAGKSVRYIDYENGKDSNDGKTKTSAWKHHPGDANAKANAKSGGNADTYVFKRGVIYRGSIVVKQHGKTGAPIRLTSDPAWGQGEAVITGAERVTGWKKSGAHKDIPNGDKVWTVDVPWLARNLWVVDGKSFVRVPLARQPNWTETNPDDVNSNWYELEQPQWWKGKNKMKVGKNTMHLGIDKKNFTKSKDHYVGAIIRPEWGVVMGTPFPTKIEAFDSAKKGVAFQGPWFRDSGQHMTANRYFIEDKPHYLDADGEFWVEKKKNSSRLYLRLPGDKDPNKANVEVGRYYNLIHDVTSADSPLRIDVLRGDHSSVPGKGLKHVEISGLSFRFTNTWWNLEFPAWMHKDVDNAAVRILGASDHVVVKNNTFQHVNKAVRMSSLTAKSPMGTMTISDNLIEYTDNGAITMQRSKDPSVNFKHGNILRNKLFMIGRRPHRQAHGHAITVNFVETFEVAGNILDRCYGAGLFLFGGKGSGRAGDAPLTRILVHHNKVTDPLLSTNDWGGIETWQGGPAYVYNNISANPGGYWHWGYQKKKPGGARFGHAYYLDGAFKNYLFNNIAWGKSNDPLSALCNTSAFQEIHSYQNTFFNNSAYRFSQGTRRQASHAGRNKYLGNVFQGISGWLYRHNSPAKTAADGNAKDAGKKKDHVDYHTLAYANNITHDIAKYGVLEPTGRWLEDKAAFDSALAQHKAKTRNSGIEAKQAPLPKADKMDFRLAANSEAVDKGSKVFVPWSLYGMVAEWSFTPTTGKPNHIMDEHWFMTHYHAGRDDYSERPMFPLQGVKLTTANYVNGDLEDWTKGALQLNGKDQYAMIPHATLAKPFTYKKKNKKKKTTEDIVVKDVYSPAIQGSNFILETVVRVDGDADGGVLIQKMGDSGYALTLGKDGTVNFAVKGGGKSAQVVSRTKLVSGQWYHILAEADRKPGSLKLYINGKLDRQAGGLGPVSLANSTDLVVGKSLKATFDFMRVAQGTLAEARTSIEELYAWQFNGPQFRDFTGKAPVGKRDAGAIESGGSSMANK